MSYVVGNPCPGLGQTQKYGEDKPLNGIQPFSLDEEVSNGNTI
jgi:hypothetical protein